MVSGFHAHRLPILILIGFVQLVNLLSMLFPEIVNLTLHVLLLAGELAVPILVIGQVGLQLRNLSPKAV